MGRRFLTVDEVLVLHRIAIEDSGGNPGLRDRPLLESAMAQAAQQFGGEYLHDSVPAMAAAYAFHICMNHPFVDGNKRAALAAMLAFLAKNDWAFDGAEDETEAAIWKLASGATEKAELIQWVQQHSHAKVSFELRHFFSSLSYDSLAQQFRAIAANVTWNETAATVEEAARLIPAARVAWSAAVAAEQAGDNSAASILRQHAILLTAVYRAAEDAGYEW